MSFKRHKFPPDVIRYAVWLYFRFTLSIRDVEELLAERGVEISREAIRCWVIKFGPLIAANLRRRRSSPTGRGPAGVGGRRRRYLTEGKRRASLGPGSVNGPDPSQVMLKPFRIQALELAVRSALANR